MGRGAGWGAQAPIPNWLGLSQPVGSHASELLACWLLSLRHGRQVDGPFQTSVCVFSAPELCPSTSCVPSVHRPTVPPSPFRPARPPSITLVTADIRRIWQHCVFRPCATITLLCRNDSLRQMAASFAQVPPRRGGEEKVDRRHAMESRPPPVIRTSLFATPCLQPRLLCIPPRCRPRRLPHATSA